MKKILSTGLCVLLVLSLAGCTGSRKPEQTTAAPAATSAAETTAAPQGTAAAASETSSAAPESTAMPESTSAAESTQASAETEAAAAPSGPIEAPAIPARQYPRVDGSTATIPLGVMLHRLCTGSGEIEARQSVQFTKTTNAYLNLIAGETDLVIAYEAGPKAKDDPGYKDLDIRPVGLDALIFLCNEGNPVKSLTSQQIRDIYTGKITNWKEVGGEDIPVIPFQRPTNSGSQTLMESLMMQGEAMSEAPTELQPSEMGDLIDSVAAYNNKANALGYSVYYYARNMYRIEGIRFMAVDGVEPSGDTIQSGQYKYVNPFYAAVRKDTDPDSPAGRIFSWLTGTDGQSLVEELGYVSVTPGGKKLPEELAPADKPEFSAAY